MREHEDLRDTCNLLYERLTSAGITKIYEVATSKDNICFSIDNDFLHICITDDAIVVLYANEHDEFWSDLYEENDALVDAVCEHVLKLVTCKITVDYYFQRFTNRLLFYKIWIHKPNGDTQMIKKVSFITFPVNLLLPKAVVTKVLRQ